MTDYAYYEKANNGRWNLVVYHGERAPKNAQGQDPKRIGPFEVLPEMINKDSTPNFAFIASVFKKPENENG